jgi:hypothetical protein
MYKVCTYQDTTWQGHCKVLIKSEQNAQPLKSLLTKFVLPVPYGSAVKMAAVGQPTQTFHVLNTEKPSSKLTNRVNAQKMVAVSLFSTVNEELVKSCSGVKLRFCQPSTVTPLQPT